MEGFIASVSKPNLSPSISSTFLSEHCFTWEVSVNIYSKTLIPLVLPMVLLLFSLLVLS